MSARRLAFVCKVLALLAGLALFVGRAAPAAASGTPTNVDVSALAGNDAEDAVAVNPTNPNNLVAMAITLAQPAGLIEGVSFNGGKTWKRQIIGGGTSDPLGDICCDQQLAWDHFGNLWMTYLLNSSGDILVALSTDGGLTWTKAADVVPTTVTGNSQPQGARHRGQVHLSQGGDQPSISAGPNSVWVSYTSEKSGELQAFGMPVTGLGGYGAVSALETVPTSNGQGDYGDTAVGPNGQVVVVYQDKENGEVGTNIYTALDPDGLGPAGFGTPRLLAHSYVGGFDYIPAQPDRSVDAEANLAWDRSGGPHNGRLYAVWTQEVGNESNNMDIELQYSDDQGATWSPVVRVNDDKTPNSQFNPAIALDQTTGNVALSWYDARNDLGAGSSGDTDGIPNTDVQIWAAYSTNGGSSLVPNFRVSAGSSNAVDANYSFDYGDYTHAAFVSGMFWPVWSDNSNGAGGNPDGTLHQLDLYTAKVTIR
ncbi:MAG TPA: sialidase family protein [Gaiellaceae bacterium]|nr:sialidase family protein [Gaiellaceae bacterium]